MTRAYYEIQATDVGKSSLRMFGQRIPVASFIGRVLPHDVGKRCYMVREIVQVENDEQRAARTAQTAVE